MKTYEPYQYPGCEKHTLEITLQLGEHKGILRQEIYGNCCGLDILQCFDPQGFDPGDLSYNDCGLKISDCDEEWFVCVLKNEEGKELAIESHIDEIGDLVVKLEIVECEKAKGD